MNKARKQLNVGLILNYINGENRAESRVIKAQGELILDLLKRVKQLEKTVDRLTSNK